MKTFLLIFLLFVCSSLAYASDPPFPNSGEINPDLIMDRDFSTFVECAYVGTENRTVFDGRTNEYPVLQMFIFTCTYLDFVGTIEFQVNPEFASVHASTPEVDFYAQIFGQLPLDLRKNLTRVTIHKGKELLRFSTRDGIIIYTDAIATLIQQHNIHQEILLHELVHASLDDLCKNTEGWLQAQAGDNAYISVYASQFPDREDCAESFVAYSVWRSERTPSEIVAIIAETMPARIAFFESLNLNLEPLFKFEFLINAGLNDAWYNPQTNGQGFFITVFPAPGLVNIAWFTYDTVRPDPNIPAELGDSGHRWMTAIGPYMGDTAVLTIQQTVGGVFDAENPAPVSVEDGTITVVFETCSVAKIFYDIPSVPVSGEIDAVRISDSNVPLCEELRRRSMYVE